MSTTMSTTEEYKKDLFPVTVSKWNSNIEKNIKDIGESCKGYKWMHIKLARSALYNYNILMYLTIAIGPLGGLFGTITASKQDFENEYTVLQILAIMCSCVTGFLASIAKYANYNQRSVDHRTAAAKYTSLEGNIRRQLSLFREDRVNAGKYLQWVSVSFDDLFAASPLISNNVYVEWAKFAKDNNLYIPKEYELSIKVDTVPAKELANIGEIRVNEGESSADLNTLAPHIPPPLPPQIKSTKTHRTHHYASYPELNRYTDPQMEYELCRLFGMNE